MTTERKTPDLVSGRALFRLGLGLVILAAVMFFRYSVERGWIEPPVRVALAGLAGIAMIVIGLQISPRRPAYGTLLQGGGSAVAYLTAFAAHQRYELIDRTSGFIGLTAVSMLVVALAVRQQSQSLGMVGVIGALTAPALIDGRLLGRGGDATYIAVIVALGVYMFLRMEWFGLYVTTAAGASIAVSVETVRLLLHRTTMPLAAPPTGAELTADAAVLLIGLWLAPTIVAVTRSSRPIELGATVGTLGVPLLSTAIALTCWHGVLDRRALMAIAVGVGVATGLVGLGIRSRRPLLAETHLVPALALPMIGWFAGVETPALLVLVVAAQAVAMIVVGVRMSHPMLTGVGQIGLAMVIAAWMGVLVRAADSVFGTADAALGAVLVLTAYASLTMYRSDLAAVSEVGVLASWLTGAGMAGWSFATLNGLANGPGLVTGAWATLGAALVVSGKIGAEAGVRNAGLGLLLVSVGKLLLVDTVGVSGLVRMGLFAGIGLGLLILGYWLGDPPDGENESPVMQTEQPASAPVD